MNTKHSNTDNSRRAFIRNSAIVAAGAMVLPRLSMGATTSDIVSPLRQDRWPGLVVVENKILDDFVALKEEASASGGWTVRTFQSVAVPTLQIRAQWRTIGAVTEWIPTLVNNSSKPSGRVNDVRSLAASWKTRGQVDFYGNEGSLCTLNDFMDRTIFNIENLDLVPLGGRSSEGVFPFFALSDQHDALAFGIGWSGRWCAKLQHADDVVRVDIGLPQVGFVLRPHESVRLPSILLAQSPGPSADRARRVVRAHLNKHVVPKAADGKSLNFTAYATVYELFKEDKSPPVNNEALEMEALERAIALGFETCWIDATWYGNKHDWDQEAGTWKVRSQDYPRGLRPISDRAHEMGMRFLFWMDPERARPGSEWALAHPELFLHYPETNEPNPDPYTRRGILLNLGDPRARDLAFTRISELITEFNAEILRLDFNMRPLDAWYAADEPDRIGITEIRYIEGLYALWDKILETYPQVMIDNCASGGRRIDLETTRRSIPLWRSDAAIDVISSTNPKMDIANQVEGWGIGHWLPEQSGPITTFDAYALRSTISTGFMAYRPLPKDKNDPEFNDAREAVAENKRLRPYFTEERIGLIAPVLDKEAWTAYQHHRRSDASGIIVALRGPGADSETVTLRPEHLDVRGMYQVTRWDDYRKAPATRMSGADLKEIDITIAKTRSSVLVEYQKMVG